MLAEYLAEGWDGAADRAGAITLLSDACDAGDANGCRFLARGRVEWVVTRAAHLGTAQARATHRRALMLFESECKAGDGESCAALARIYGLGDGVAKNHEKRKRWSEQACAAHQEEECAWLAVNAAGASDESKKLLERRARDAQQRGCARGLARACRRLAVANGASAKGTELRARAVRIYGEQCKQRHPPSCLAAAELSWSRPDAVAWYRLACELGLGRACPKVSGAAAPEKTTVPGPSP